MFTMWEELKGLVLPVSPSSLTAPAGCVAGGLHDLVLVAVWVWLFFLFILGQQGEVIHTAGTAHNGCFLQSAPMVPSVC